MRGMRTTAGLVAVMVTFGATGAAAAPLGEPERESLQFLDISRQVAEHHVGLRSSEQRPGDMYVFDNLLRHPDRSDAATRQVLGRFPSTCTVTTGTQARCAGTLELRDGSIDVAGTPDLAGAPIDMVVTGGSGRYESVRGSARLTATDTPGTSLLTVQLERPAR